MIRTRRWTVPAIFALIVWLAWYAAAGAYVGQNPYIVQLRGPDGPVRCDASAQITAVVRSSETGELVQGQTVHWDVSKSPSNGDTVRPATTVTDADGRATTTLRFGPAEGQRTVRAIIIPDFPETIKVKCQGGLATAPPKTPTPTSQPTPSTQPTPSESVSSTASPAPTSASPSPAPASPTVAPASASPTVAPASAGPTVAPATLAPTPVTPSQSPGTLPVVSPATTQLDLLPIALVALVGAAGVTGAAFVLVRRR